MRRTPTDLYFAPKFFESRTLYEALGVGVARRLIVGLGRRTGHDPRRPNRYFLWDSSVAGLRAFEKKTRGSEVMHLAGLVLPGIALLQGASGWTAVVLWVVLILNVYPWLLQRYTRLRIQHVLAARGKRL